MLCTEAETMSNVFPTIEVFDLTSFAVICVLVSVSNDSMSIRMGNHRPEKGSKGNINSLLHVFVNEI